MSLEAARGRSRRVLAAGVVAFWIVVLTLAFGAGMRLTDAVALAVLFTVVPAAAVAQVFLVDEIEIERMPAYASSIVTLWLLGSAAWLLGTVGVGPSGVGFVWIGVTATLAWSAGLTVAALGIIVVFRWLAIRLGAADRPLLRQLLPRTSRERATFALLSLAAGCGEELAFRGYAMTALAPVTGLGTAAVLTSVAFGVVHAYQGPLGVVRTGLMGGVLAWGFVGSGSLIPAVVAHVLLDVVAGLWLGERLLTPPASILLAETCDASD